MTGKAWTYTKPAAGAGAASQENVASAAADKTAEIASAAAEAKTPADDQPISPAVVPMIPRVAEERSAAADISGSDGDGDSENEMMGDFLDDLDSSDSD